MRKILICILFSTLIFSGCKKDDSTTPTPTPTSLEIHLKDYLGNIVSSASVKLYATLTDWNNGTNQVGTTQYSDGLGNVIFYNLANIQYYWYAEKDCQNNINGAVTTTYPLTANVNNNVNVILSSTGTLAFISTSTNPYHIYINGTFAFDMNGGTTQYRYNMPTGSYTIRVIQISGYVLYPTDETFNGTVTCGSTFTTTFP